MKKYNIAKPRNYTDKQGVERTYWDRVGEMVEFEKEGRVSRIIKIPAIGLEANVFEEKPREEYAQKAKSNEPPAEIYEDGSVDIKDVPF